MSVLIKGMKMPKNCAECPCEHYECLLLDKDAEDIMQYFTGDKRHPDCPLVELPPHGRLIDADALNDMINRSYPMTDRVDVHNGYGICQEMIKQLPTIVEAEVEE